MSGSSPREGSARRLVYRIRNRDGSYRGADGTYSVWGKIWRKRGHLTQHYRQTTVPFDEGDEVIVYKLTQFRSFPITDLAAPPRGAA